MTKLPATIAVCLLCILPIFVAQTLPLYDYQFHIARMHILTEWRYSEFLKSYYNVGSFMLSNIAMDIIVPWLAYWVSVETAGRVFIALTIILQISGCMMLYRSIHGRYSWWPLVSALFVFNWIFIFAFANYLFGIGLMLWGVALWIMLSERSLLLSILCGTIFSVILFFCHLIVLGLFAVTIAGYELRRAYDVQKYSTSRALTYLLAGASIFIIPAILYLMSTTAQAGGLTSHNLTNLLRTPAIFVRILLSANWPLDGILLATILAFLGIVFLRGKILVASTMYLVIGFLLLVYLIMPHVLAGVWGVDSRIPIVIMFILIASTQPVFRNAFWKKIAVYGLFGVLVLRTALLTYNWYAYDQVYAEIRKAFDALPNESTLFSVNEDAIPSIQDFKLHLWQPPLYHVASLAALHRNIFVPQTWATSGVEPLVVRPEWQAMYQFQDNGPIQVTSSEELQAVVTRARQLATKSAYLLVLYPHSGNLALPPNTKTIASGEYFVLLAL